MIIVGVTRDRGNLVDLFEPPGLPSRLSSPSQNGELYDPQDPAHLTTRL